MTNPIKDYQLLHTLLAMSLINASRDRPNYSVGYFRIIVCRNVTPTTAVSCSVATLPSESLRNDGEKPNQSKRRLFPKCGYDKDFRKVRASVTQQKWYS